MDWLAESPWLAWLGIALVLAAIEAITVDFVFVMLAGGALAGAVTAGVGGGLTAQVVAAVVTAIVLLLVVRPVVKKHLVDGEVEHNIGAASLVGREARVLAEVTDSDGRIKLAGDTWTARTAEGAHPIPAGADVIVVALQGATAIVVPAATPRLGDETR